MENQLNPANERMVALIKESCDLNERSNIDFFGFQKTLLKFYFNVVDVSIDYKNKVIYLWHSHSDEDETDNLYRLNEAFATKVRYTNLEETLLGCLEDGPLQKRFYRNLLFYYNFMRNDGAISA